MTTAALPRSSAPPALTPDDLLRMGDAGKGYELIDGRLKEKEMSGRSSRVGGRVFSKLDTHSDTVSPLWVFGPDAGFTCFPDHPGRVRKPDAAVIAYSRMTQEEYERDGFIPTVPDLVVEVVSPTDLAREVDTKRREWLKAGVKEVWVVYPDSQAVQVYQVGGSTDLGPADTITSPLILPGFALPVAEFFRLPAPPAGSSQVPAAAGE